MKGKRTLRYGRAIKLAAFLASSLALLVMLAGCGQSSKPYFYEKEREKW